MERLKVTKVGSGTLHAKGRRRLPFRSVNRPGQPGYQVGMQRHHLLPRQLFNNSSFRPLFDLVGRERLGFDDFRTNGLLLPAMERAASVLGLPLHRGPHRRYNEAVAERVAQIEYEWANARLRNGRQAMDDALMRLRLLQSALRRSLLKPGLRWIPLNRHDPLGHGVDFSELDAMAETIWDETGQRSAPLEQN